MSTHPNPRIAELQAEIDRLKAADSAALKARAEAVVPVYRWTITPAAKSERRFERIMDESVTLWRLDAHLENAAECSAVGKKPMTGGMTYLFNEASGKFIMGTGGGSVWISAGAGSFNENSPECRVTFARLADFITAHPEGGDVTSIIAEHRAAVGAK